MVGQRLNGRYELLSEIARGGMGIVYRGRDLALGREVAVKILPPSLRGGETPLRFMREARTMAQLQHPNIVAIHDVGEDDGAPYFVMELIEGPRLRNFFTTENLPGFFDIAVQICRALDYAHSKGVVHRDVKPSNILLSSLGLVKLADFGLARAMEMERISVSGAFIGTAAYIPPEQAMSENVDARSDLYSLGVVLYELACGRLPFTSDSPFSVVFQHLHTSPVTPRLYNPNISAGLEQIILKLLRKDPAERYPSAAQVIEAMEAMRDAEKLGVATPVVTSVEDVSTSVLLSAIGKATMVGRETEWTRLQESIHQCAQGAGGVALVAGDMGVGKTRLMREASVYARLKGFRVLSGQCEAGEGIPYKPFAEAALQYLRSATVAALSRSLAAELVKLSAAIAEHLNDVAPHPPLEPRQERARLFEAVGQFLRGVAEREAPLILLVDDLHRVDEPTAALLLHLARQCRDTRLLIVGGYRDVEVELNPHLENALIEMNRERLCQDISLSGLTENEVRALLADLMDAECSPDFSRAIYQQTQGNPFFIEETLRDLIEDNALYLQGGEWRVKEATQIQLPETVQAAVWQRLRRLSEECQRLLTTAAVVGQQFTFEVLTEVTRVPEMTLLDWLDEVLSAKLVSEGKEGSQVVYRFRHAAIREALYGSLNLRRKVMLHGQVGLALEELSGGREEVYGALAHHFSQSDHADKAAFYSMKTGQQAQRLYDNLTALKYLTDALDKLTPQHRQWQVETLRSLGEIHFTMGEHAQAESDLKEALESATALDVDAESLAMLHFQIADAVHWQERYQESLEWAERGLRLLEDSPPSQAKACLLDVISRSCHALSNFGDRERYVERAASTAFRMSEFVRELEYFAYLHEIYYRIAFWSAYWKQDYPQGLRWLDEGLALCAQRDDKRGVARCLHGMADVYRWMGEPAQAAEHYLKSLEISERIGDAHTTVENHREGAVVLSEIGRLDEAIAHAQKGVEIAKAIGRVDYLRGPMGLAGLARLYLQRGDPASAIACLQEAQTIAKSDAEKEDLQAELERCRQRDAGQEAGNESAPPALSLNP
jgi:tetratricopeptide (TPR) repeat protein/tRNA A-37 threonylcarbamoyl transferase component Bud32